MVPHLTTALTGPLLELERRFLDSSTQIEHWLRGQWQEHTPPFYSSCDLRNAGFKLAPVDTNLFPGGFNNLNAGLPAALRAGGDGGDRKDLPGCAQSAADPGEPHAQPVLPAERRADRRHPAPDRPQRPPRLDVAGNHPPDTGRTAQRPAPAARTAGAHANRLGLDGFDPCAILLNNDLSAGIPDILKATQRAVHLPPLHAGWAVRRKSNHFAAYDEVANDFAKEIGIDPWRINPAFSVCRSINFHERQGEECLAANVAAVLDIVREKYKEYGIDETPYVVVKADAGTYGMGS
jgi:glutamate--cysteine ligase